MRIAKALACALATLAAPAYARRADPTPARPIGNPADWISTDDYPAYAIRKAETGITGVTLTVNAAGHVSACKVTQPSGSQSLDEATCDRLLLRAQFTPALSPSGKPIVGTYCNRVRWALPDEKEALGFSKTVTMP